MEDKLSNSNNNINSELATKLINKIKKYKSNNQRKTKSINKFLSIKPNLLRNIIEFSSFSEAREFVILNRYFSTSLRKFNFMKELEERSLGIENRKCFNKTVEEYNLTKVKSVTRNIIKYELCLNIDMIILHLNELESQVTVWSLSNFLYKTKITERNSEGILLDNVCMKYIPYNNLLLVVYNDGIIYGYKLSRSLVDNKSLLAISKEANNDKINNSLFLLHKFEIDINQLMLKNLTTDYKNTVSDIVTFNLIFKRKVDPLLIKSIHYVQSTNQFVTIECTGKDDNDNIEITFIKLWDAITGKHCHTKCLQDKSICNFNLLDPLDNYKNNIYFFLSCENGFIYYRDYEKLLYHPDEDVIAFYDCLKGDSLVLSTDVFYYEYSSYNYTKSNVDEKLSFLEESNKDKFTLDNNIKTNYYSFNTSNNNIVNNQCSINSYNIQVEKNLISSLKDIDKNNINTDNRRMFLIASYASNTIITWDVKNKVKISLYKFEYEIKNIVTFSDKTANMFIYLYNNIVNNNYNCNSDKQFNDVLNNLSDNITSDSIYFIGSYKSNKLMIVDAFDIDISHEAIKAKKAVIDIYTGLSPISNITYFKTKIEDYSNNEIINLLNKECKNKILNSFPFIYSNFIISKDKDLYILNYNNYYKSIDLSNKNSHRATIKNIVYNFRTKEIITSDVEGKFKVWLYINDKFSLIVSKEPKDNKSIVKADNMIILHSYIDVILAINKTKTIYIIRYDKAFIEIINKVEDLSNDKFVSLLDLHNGYSFIVGKSNGTMAYYHYNSKFQLYKKSELKHINVSNTLIEKYKISNSKLLLKSKNSGIISSVKELYSIENLCNNLNTPDNNNIKLEANTDTTNYCKSLPELVKQKITCIIYTNNISPIINNINSVNNNKNSNSLSNIVNSKELTKKTRFVKLEINDNLIKNKSKKYYIISGAVDGSICISNLKTCSPLYYLEANDSHKHQIINIILYEKYEELYFIYLIDNGKLIVKDINNKIHSTYSNDRCISYIDILNTNYFYYTEKSTNNIYICNLCDIFSTLSVVKLIKTSYDIAFSKFLNDGESIVSYGYDSVDGNTKPGSSLDFIKFNVDDNKVDFFDNNSVFDIYSVNSFNSKNKHMVFDDSDKSSIDEDIT